VGLGLELQLGLGLATYRLNLDLTLMFSESVDLNLDSDLEKGLRLGLAAMGLDYISTPRLGKYSLNTSGLGNNSSTLGRHNLCYISSMSVCVSQCIGL